MRQIKKKTDLNLPTSKISVIMNRINTALKTEICRFDIL